MKPAIGLLDSGIGGLSLLAALIPALPGRRFLYVADTANVPYGNRPPETLKQLAFDAVSFLQSRNVSSVILACNTLTATCAPDLRARNPGFPIIGVEPALRPAVRMYDRNIGVLATCATLRSPKFLALAESLGKERFRFLPQVNLAKEIERHFGDNPEPALRHELSFPAEDLSCLVLGCTHYCLVKNQIARITGLPLLDGTEGTVRQLLRKESPGTDPFELTVFVTDPRSVPAYQSVLSKLKLPVSGLSVLNPFHGSAGHNAF